MSMLIACASTGGHDDAIESWVDTMYQPHVVAVDDTIKGEAAGWLGKIQRIYQYSTQDVIAYFHNDLIIHQTGWDELVLAQFEDPNVAVVSFSGALGHGAPHIYQVPYQTVQLARYDFLSNLTDAEAHGRRWLHPCDVATVDSFSMIVRRSFLDEVGGWPIACYPPSHCSDYWLCLMAHRHKLKVRYVPVACSHASGGVRGDGRFNYAKWISGTKWESDANCHRISHELIYGDFRDVLPVRVPLPEGW